MRDEYETNRYNEQDLWRFSIGDLVQLRADTSTHGTIYTGPALVVDRHVDGAYVEARPIKYQTQERYRLVYAGESLWMPAALLERSSEEQQHTP